MASELKRTQPKTQHNQSGKKHIGKIFLDNLINNKMCESFYFDLETKMRNNENHVRDIIKLYKSHDENTSFEKTSFEKTSFEKTSFEKTSFEKTSFEETSFDRNLINKILLRFFDRNAFTIGYNKLTRIHSFTDEEISEMDPKQFAEHDSFIVMGCDESTDIDVVCFIGSDQKHYIKDGKTKELSAKSLEQLKSDLKKCGYDVENRKLDITTAYVDPETKIIIASSKGGVETQNIVLETWTNHKQIMYSQTQETKTQETKTQETKTQETKTQETKTQETKTQETKTQETKTQEKNTINEMIPLALHLHPMKKIEFTQKEIFDKLRSFAKYALDHCEVITTKDDYKKFRPIKADLYIKGGDHMMKYMNNILKHIIHDPVEASDKKINMNEWHDKFKSMVMKLLQIICLYKCGKIAYKKRDIAKFVRDIFEDDSKDEIVDKYESIATWYLFRGRIGIFDPVLGPKFFELLIDNYCEIVDDFLQRIDVKPITFDLKEIIRVKSENKIMSNISEDLLMMFLKSPNKPTNEFEKEWNDKFKMSDLNSLFLIKSSDQKEFYEYYEKELRIDEKIISVFKQCFVFIDQRSSEWLDMLENKYVCGKNSGIIDNSFQGLYNLIRGSIIEQLAIHLFDLSSVFVDIDKNNYRKWHLGFIVESDMIGSKGFAPDMILIGINPETKTLELIIVEIKGLKSTKLNRPEVTLTCRNADYYRGLNLATKQVESCKKILSQYLSPKQLIMRRGLILLCYVDDMNLMMDIHQIKI
jgi:hypothetical protein